MHQQEAEMSRPATVLAGILCALNHGEYRTKLVKLTYLLDEANYRLRGETMTGFEYVWDNYGPNAEGNSIVATMDKMIDKGILTMHTHSIMGNAAYRYEINPKYPVDDLPLSNDDWIAICEVIHKYGDLNRERIVSKSKATRPMRNARQGDDLVFIQEPPISRRDIAEDPFWQDTLEAINDPGKPVPLEDLQTSCA